MVEITLKPRNITSLTDLNSNLTGNYEISTTITQDSIDVAKIQEVSNKLSENGKKLSIKPSNSNLETQLILEKADGTNINDANSILGNINGITDEITIRIYNCSDDQIKQIKDNFEVINIRNF